MQKNNSGIGEKEKIVEIEIERLREFRGHPFKVRQDEQMDMLMESIKKYGMFRPSDLVADAKRWGIVGCTAEPKTLAKFIRDNQEALEQDMRVQITERDTATGHQFILTEVA